MDRIELRRALGLPLFIFYGLGTILGAGIYSLIGEVAGSAGMYAPIAFVVAAVIAGFTGLTYAELSSRYPKSAAEAVYVREGLGWPRLASLVGLLIVMSATVSSATLANAFVGYAHKLIELFTTPEFVADNWFLNRPLLVAAIVLAMGALAAWGIRESVIVASVVTVIEIAGLLLIVWVSGDALAELPARVDELLPPPGLSVWNGILIGAFVAFYAFIGFEDMANIAEEVRDPQRTLPRGIITAVIVSTLLYLLVALSAVLALPPVELAASEAPMALLYEQGTGRAPWVITLISLFAVINGALIQIIMASRVLYGISRQGWIPQGFGQVHARTRTPLLATASVTVLVLLLALPLTLRTLADTTSFIVLIIFSLVNLSLLRVKLREPVVAGVRVLPVWIPVLGLLCSGGFLLVKLGEVILH